MEAASGPMADAELSEVAHEICSLFFRAGLLLGMQPYELDRLEDDARRQGLSAWHMNMQLLRRWKERTNARSERSELARMLKKLHKGRLAAFVDPSVRDWEPKSVIDCSNESLSAQELEEISRDPGVCECWRRLAVYLEVDDTRVQAIDATREDVAVKAFRCLWAWREAGNNVSKANLAVALKKVQKGRLASKIWPASTSA